MLSSFTEELEKRNWLLADGAIGTNLFEMGLSNGDAPEIWNETEPQKIKTCIECLEMLGVKYF